MTAADPFSNRGLDLRREMMIALPGNRRPAIRRRVAACVRSFGVDISACLVATAVVLTLFPGDPTIAQLDAAEPGSTSDELLTQALKRHAYFLASDQLAGRAAGSDGSRAAAVYLVDQLQQLKAQGLRPGGSYGTYFQEFRSSYRNLLAELPGQEADGPVIVVGAHYDHVGLGNRRNSHGPWGRVHNGADDNASGTTVLLEVARRLSSGAAAGRRSTVLFAFWDAEEDGLLGSRHWVRSPTVRLNRVLLTVNLDMVGRMREERLKVLGWRTGVGFRQLVTRSNVELGLDLDFDTSIRGDSDHYPFFEQSRPFLMFFTGKHDDYHRPSDDVDKLNFDGMRQVVELVARTVEEVERADESLAFRPHSKLEAAPYAASVAPEPEIESRFGVRFQPASEHPGQVELTFVGKGTPAEQAGLRVGDRIVRFGGWPASADFDFRTLVLAAPKTCPVRVARGNRILDQSGTDGRVVEMLDLVVKLTGAPLRIGLFWGTDEADPGSLVLTSVIPGSPAWTAGLRPGDRLWEVSGEAVDVSGSPRTQLLSAGDRFELRYERRGRLRDAKLRLLPDPGSSAPGERAAETGVAAEEG